MNLGDEMSIYEMQSTRELQAEIAELKVQVRDLERSRVHLRGALMFTMMAGFSAVFNICLYLSEKF
jgi:hypothetical protein